MGKFNLPTCQQFLDKKTIYGPKKDPIWVRLEQEMQKNIEKKPYNVKVGAWLRFLKDLKYHYFCENRRKYRRLAREVGPVWYYELSTHQREVLMDLKANIHQDLLEDIPNRIRKSLADLGITLRIPTKMLMKAMNESIEDPGMFIWNLYQAIYKQSPSELRSKYDINGMLLMSALVFIDLDECVEKLEQLTHYDKPPVVQKKNKIRPNYLPNVRYGEYLQQNYVRCYLPHEKDKKKQGPLPLGYKFRLRSEESYEKLCLDNGFLEKRKERNKISQQKERVCTYKFWEPPSSLRYTDPKMRAYAIKLKMIKKKAKLKHGTQFKNVQFQVGGVGFTRGTPRFILNNVGILPTGYVPINGGTCLTINGDPVMLVMGYWKFPREVKEACVETCDCLNQWEGKVMEYIKESKCKCGHLYDFNNEGKVKEVFFRPPTRFGPYAIDEPRIYQMDPTEEFIKSTVQEALRSGGLTPAESTPTVSASGLKEKELLAAFLADLSDTPLLIPHLPQANLLNNLQEWVRKRVKGSIEPKQHKNFKLQSGRRWLDLKHMDFRARAYMIPFTLKELEHINWSHRVLIQKLFSILLNDYVTRNRLKQVEQTRLYWPTMKFDAYPSKPFLDVFFTYMPGRMKDSFFINPYSAERTPKYGAKTCPLNN